METHSQMEGQARNNQRPPVVEAGDDRSAKGDPREGKLIRALSPYVELGCSPLSYTAHSSDNSCLTVSTTIWDVNALRMRLTKGAGRETESFDGVDFASTSPAFVLPGLGVIAMTDRTFCIPFLRRRLLQSRALFQNQNLNADEQLRSQRTPHLLTVNYCRLPPCDTNRSANYPDHCRSQSKAAGKKDAMNKLVPLQKNTNSLSLTDSEAEAQTRKVRCRYHEVCKPTLYPPPPVKPEKGSKGKKHSRASSSRPPPSEKKTSPPPPKSTSKYHTNCLQSIPPLSVRKKYSPQELVPYGGPQHPYQCPRRAIPSVYNSRVEDKAFSAECKTRIRNYYKNFCMRCNAIYSDGICRREYGCKNYDPSKGNPLAAPKGYGQPKKKKIIVRRDKSTKRKICSCRYVKKFEPEEVTWGEDTEELIGDNRYFVEADEDNRADCRITMNQSAVPPEEGCFVKMVIVELDTSEQSGFRRVVDRVRFDPEAISLASRASLLTDEQRKDTSRDPTIEYKVGKFSQYQKLAVRDIRLSADAAEEEPIGVSASSSLRKTESDRIPWKDKTQVFGSPSILKGRMVTHASFCAKEPGLLVTVHTKLEHTPDDMPCKLMCVWNASDVRRPIKMLTEVDKLTCVFYSPVSTAHVLAGMLDGSVKVWDTESANPKQHTLKTLKNRSEKIQVDLPIYRSSHGKHSHGHSAPIVSIASLPSTDLPIKSKRDSLTNDSSQNADVNFKLASIAGNGVIIIWQFEKIREKKSSAAERMEREGDTEPRYRMLKTLQITMEDLTSETGPDIEWGSLVLQFSSDSKSRLFGSGLGGASVQYHIGPVMGELATPQCIHFSPFNSMFFLAGMEDGRVIMCHTGRKDPVLLFKPHPDDMKPVKAVEWSPTRPAVFYVLHVESSAKIYDLLLDRRSPIYTIHPEEGMGNFIAMVHSGYSRAATYHVGPMRLLLATSSGRTEIHNLNDIITLQEDYRERRFLKALLS